MSGLREHLQTIHDDNGYLTPHLVRETARPKTHPLHGAVFDKAPKDAAEAYYLERAHQLITEAYVVVRVATDTTPAASIRAFHAVRTDRGHVYEPAETVAQDPLLRAMALQDMERRWMELKRRFLEFSEFVEMIRDDPDVQVA